MLSNIYWGVEFLRDLQFCIMWPDLHVCTTRIPTLIAHRSAGRGETELRTPYKELKCSWCGLFWQVWMCSTGWKQTLEQFVCGELTSIRLCCSLATMATHRRQTWSRGEVWSLEEIWCDDIFRDSSGQWVIGMFSDFWFICCILVHFTDSWTDSDPNG